MICNSVEEFLEKYTKGHYLSDLDFVDDEMYKDLFNYCVNKKTKEALLLVAGLYSEGKGVTKNLSKAFKIYELLANDRLARAQYNLGTMYAQGEGVDQNGLKAKEWYEKAAIQDYVDAQYTLGHMYYKGELIPQDYKRAIEWFLRASNQGDSDSQYYLGLMNHNGWGTKKNYKEAVKWYTLSAEKGDPYSQYNLSTMYYEGKGVTRNLKTSFYWVKLSAEQNYEVAQYNLATMYYDGEGTKQDLKKALYWYTKAAKQGDMDALSNLGSMYYNGEGTEKDLNKAFESFTKAAYNGNINAQNNLALMYYKGEGTTKDYSKSFEWYAKAAEQDDSSAQYWLATMYYEGEGIKRDLKEAFKWYKKAANQGELSAQYEVASMYYKGEGVKQDLNKALDVANLCYNNGVEDAKDLILDIKEKQQCLNYENVLHFGQRNDVFISWNHNDIEIKDEICSELEKNNIFTVWESDGKGYGELTSIIKDAINNSKIYIVILTENSIKSQWVEEEVNYMLELNKNRSLYKKIIPLYINSEISEEIKKMDKKSVFKKIYNVGAEYTHNGKINYDKLKSIIKEAIEITIIEDHKEKLIKTKHTFIGALAKAIENKKSKYKDKTISTVMDFDTSYIDRSLYSNETEYKIDDVLYNKYSLIYGEGGIGKSLYLKQILINHFTNNKYILNVECKEVIKNKNLKFLDILRLNTINSEDNKNYQISIKGFERIFNTNNEVLIMIDALDEVNQEERKQLIRKIKIFNKEHENVKYIFTSRNLNDYLLLENSFQEVVKTYELKGLNEFERIKLFDIIVEKCKGIQIKNKEINNKYFFKFLKNLSENVKENPFLLSNLIFIYLASGEIPRSEYEIISKIIEIWIDGINKGKDVKFKYEKYIDNDSLIQLLCFISFERSRNNRTDIQQLIENFIKDSVGIKDCSTKIISELYSYLKDRGIIVNGNISHEIYKDYFASNYIYNNTYIKKIDKFHRNYIDYTTDNDPAKLKGEKFLDSIVNENLCINEQTWANITSNILVKLDYQIYRINNNIMSEKHTCYKVLNDFLYKGLTESKFSQKAIVNIENIIDRKTLYYYEFVKGYITDRT